MRQACGKDLQCALHHWLDDGIEEGRQGSPDFSVADYLDRYPDLQKTLGKQNYADALDHWLNSGKDEGRDGRPESGEDGPVSGPQHAGGDGGSPWYDKCKGQYVDGFRLRYGGTVDKVQFHYSRSGWQQPHGYAGNRPDMVNVMLHDGEYIVSVSYASGSRIDSLSFKTNTGRTFGPYGGHGSNNRTYTVTPGEKLGCMSGRSGSSIDRLLFSSTGLR